VLGLLGRAERNAVRLEEMLDALRDQVTGSGPTGG
jgi:hypothetical protein